MNQRITYTSSSSSRTLAEMFTFSAKERDAETGLSYFGSRYYSSDLSIWLSVDPMSDKYPSLSPYVYCANNPVKLVDPEGEDYLEKPYLIFNGAKGILQIFDDNNTPDDFSDDCFIGEFDAHNNVDNKSKGKWEDGKYAMQDKYKPNTHGEKVDKRDVKLDSPNGAYGESGIFRAKDFKEKTTGIIRKGMGIHAGRENKIFSKRVTEGCIRTTPEAMDAIIKAVRDYGPLQTIYVQENRTSPQSNDMKTINPQKRYIAREVFVNP